MKWAYRITVIVVALAAAAGIAVYAGLGGLDSAEAAVEMGTKMPEFTMKDYNGAEHKLSDFAGKIVVLQFSSHQCPYSAGADPQISDFAKEYADKGVVVLGIDSHKDTTPEQIKEYAAGKNLTHPILKDTGSRYAKEVGAKRTPEVFIVDKEGNLVYHGGWDSRSGTEFNPEAEQYTKNAVDALLAGNKPDPATTKAWGCGIKFAD